MSRATPKSIQGLDADKNREINEEEEEELNGRKRVPSDGMPLAMEIGTAPRPQEVIMT